MHQNRAAGIQITPYQAEDRSAVRSILAHIGWDERYIVAFEQTAESFARRDDTAVYVARLDTTAVGFLFVQFYDWNRLCQIQGLAVDPASQRHGAASALVAQAEAFARSHDARGIYVDTPTTNAGGRHFYEAAGYQVGYIMPRYYEDALDGVTYQKFFGSTEQPTLSAAEAAARVQITGHRGARGIAPENTLAGFQVALNLSVDIIELDVHLTRDGELVVMHDPHVERTTDGAGAIGSYTLAELKRLSAAAEFGGEAQYGVQRVPTLQEVYDLVGGRCTVNVEVKPAADGTRYPGIEEKLVEFLHRNDPANRTVISSFNHPTLVKIHALEPRLRRHGIVSHDYFELAASLGKGAGDVVDDFVARGVDWVSVHKSFMSQELCTKMKQAGMSVHVWIVDDIAGLISFAAMGVDEITTDRPDVLLAPRR